MIPVARDFKAVPNRILVSTRVFVIPPSESLCMPRTRFACFFLLQNYNEAGHVNIGWGEDISIKELATLIASEVGYIGNLEFDSTKPDGTLRKLLDTTKINNLGWKPSIKLQDGIRRTIEEVKNQF